ncbi:MAG: DHA1 family bicyclomycin/chloramphenicol resistance-like MFS transporter [Candidatus Poriferisodalaceae bacterium]|jgi:DHA1 family bicyclomycin/chloramphenicol resistance-like MFS transporter
MSATMALMALGVDMMLPAFDDMREAFGLGDDATQIGQIVTVYFLGVGLGQLFWGPLADRFGRKPVLLAGVIAYVIGAAASALAPSLGVLLATRFFWGLGAASPRVVATAVLRDSFEGTAMARAMSHVMAVFMIVPIIAPVVGSGLLVIFPWRSVFWACAVMSGFLLFWSIRLKETLDPAYRREINPGQLWDGLRRVVRTRVTAGYTLASVFIQAVMTLYLTTSEFLVGEVYGRPGWFPVIFGAVALFFAAGAIVNSRLVVRLGMPQIMRRTSFLLAGFATTLGVVTVGVSGRPNMVLFFALLGLTMASFMALTPNLNTAALTPMADMAGTASSLISAGRLLFGALIGGTLTALVGDSQNGFVLAVMVLVALAITAIAITDRAGASV